MWTGTAISGKEFSFLTSVSLALYELVRHAHFRSITRSIKVRLHDRSCRILTLFFLYLIYLIITFAQENLSDVYSMGTVP